MLSLRSDLAMKAVPGVSSAPGTVVDRLRPLHGTGPVLSFLPAKEH